MLLEGEVNNGGFNQYFFNSSSDYSLEALQGYRRYNATEHARVVRAAIEIFHQERWFHHRIRLRRSLESFFESYQYTKLGAVDAEFYDLDEEIAALRAAFIRANLDQFAS
jgi:hypothetical protein